MEELYNLCTEEEQQFIDKQLAVFADPTANRDSLMAVSNDQAIIKLEKRYVPQINPTISSEIGCDTLISTVGLRKLPVLLSILCLRPKRVFLLHTNASRYMAEEIRDDADVQALGLKPNLDTSLKEISQTNAPQIYDILQHEILPRARGKVVIDPTGGIKVMGLSLAAFAFWRRIPMVYLLGEEVKGVVKPFSERLTRVENPYDHFGDPDFTLLKELFDRGNYPAALEVCRGLEKTVGDPATLGRLAVLGWLIELYRDWDAFLHSHEKIEVPERRLGTRLAAIIDDMKRLHIGIIDAGQLSQNLEFLQGLENSWRRGRNNAEPYRLVDIYTNAGRRARLGQYDDAVARLYRCLEMSATLQLVTRWQVGSPDAPDTRHIEAAVGGREQLVQGYASLQGRPLPPPGSRWSLDDQMAILQIVEPSNNAAAVYRSMRKNIAGEETLMEKRNRSILAHGTIPVTEGEARSFDDKVRAIIEDSIGTKVFRRLEKQARHPILLIERDARMSVG
ncbi:MAG: TIGR02710 family CRISPR-associated protein [Chloroflexi bacterium]|nr:TIGR02710 family CRISPR-associated protein [Chloroflexota bacterium]